MYKKKFFSLFSLHYGMYSHLVFLYKTSYVRLERERERESVFRLTFILCISLEMFAYGYFVLLYNCYLFPTNSFCQMSYICYQSINKFVLKLNLYIIVCLFVYLHEVQVKVSNHLFVVRPFGIFSHFFTSSMKPLGQI